MRQYLTRKQAAARYGMSEAGLRRMDQEGRGPRITRIGRLVRYSEDALDEWAERHTQRRPDGAPK